uniref:ShKT domain-containing protein n=1 Tax=Caenorhabditis tropicalis TaxID=1561998 RepID=A0A1I7SY69_9PELO
MPREWFFILFPFIFFSFANAACTSGCPSGGIWGPWSTSATCPDTCGACTNLTYTRTCLSTQINSSCTCSGSNTISMPCATQACNYPRANGSMTTCCIGSPMVINNWYHCGPLASTNTLTCCPDGGYWSAWSSWTKQADKIQVS